jgi:hypothetical protein
VSLNKLIIDTLSPLSVPVDFRIYEGEATTYITFYEISDQGVLYGDDQEKKSEHLIQVKVTSKGNLTNLVEGVHRLMISAGFTKNAYFDDFEFETRTYHKVMRFYYVSNSI